MKIRSTTAPFNGLTGLSNSSAGLIIATIADDEAATTAYTQAGSTIQTIATLGTYAAPSASNCRFAKVDDTNHPGICEIQLANARFNVSSAKSLLVSITGVSGMCDCDVTIPLRSVNPYDGIAGGMSAFPAVASGGAGGLLGCVGRGVVGSSSTSTSIVTSSLTPAATDINQFLGRVVIFDNVTTTAGLRGQATNITASTAGGTLTVNALTEIPANGDTFGIY